MEVLQLVLWLEVPEVPEVPEVQEDLHLVEDLLGLQVHWSRLRTHMRLVMFLLLQEMEVMQEMEVPVQPVERHKLVVPVVPVVLLVLEVLRTLEV
jgi:hypothetical protein